MHCVSPLWFHHTLDAGYCLVEGDYLVKDGGAQKAEPGWVSSLEAFKLPDIAGDEFLHGCKVRGCGGRVRVVCFKWIVCLQVYLCGFTERQVDKLVAVVNRGGGVRCSALTNAVTQVVMGEREVKVLEQAGELDK